MLNKTLQCKQIIPNYAFVNKLEFTFPSWNLNLNVTAPRLGFATLKVNPELMIQVATVNVDNRKAVNV